MSGESSKIQDAWSDDYRTWLTSRFGLANRHTLNQHVACARTYLVYLGNTEGFTFREWMVQHKRMPGTARMAESAVRKFQVYLDENHQAALATN